MVEFISVDYSGLQILSYLYFKKKDGATFTEIEKNTKLSSRTISLQLKKLERQKLLARQPAGKDKFSKVFYRITEKGINLLLDEINEDNDFKTFYPEKSKRWDKFSEFLFQQLSKLCLNLKKNKNYFTAKYVNDWYSLVRAIVSGYVIMDEDKFYLTPLSVFELSKQIRMKLMDITNMLECLKQISSMLDLKYSHVLTKIEHLKELEKELDKFTELLWLEMMEIALKEKKEELLQEFTKEESSEDLKKDLGNSLKMIQESYEKGIESSKNE